MKGVKAVTAILEEKKAEVTLKSDISNEILKTAVEDVGFEVTNVE